MDPKPNPYRRRDLIIAIVTGFFAAVLVFAAMGCIEAGQNDAKYYALLLIVLPLLIVLARASAAFLQAALHTDQGPPPEQPEQPEQED